MFTIRNMEYINEIIKRRAKVLGLKQVDIVRKTRATKGTVSKWFSGDRKPQIDRRFVRSNTNQAC
jgi:transcriptional regulator with XRE-family HTH domain